MNKNQANIFLRLIAAIITHPWLKLVSLLLAVIIWFYAKGQKI